MGSRHVGGPFLYNQDRSPFDGMPLEFAAFLERFIGIKIGHGKYDGPAAAGTENGIVVTDIAGTGAITVDTEGRVVITTGTTDENRTQIQFKRPQFNLSSTRKCWIGARLKVSTAITTDLFFGLASVDTTVVTAAAGAVDVDDGLFFFKAATETDLTAHARSNDTSASQAMGITIADDTYIIVALVLDGGKVRAYAVSDPNDLFANNIPGLFGAGVEVASPVIANDTDLCLTIAAGQEGGTTARVVTVDWAFAVQSHA